jgi:hypothetical protein
MTFREVAQKFEIRSGAVYYTFREREKVEAAINSPLKKKCSSGVRLAKLDLEVMEFLHTARGKKFPISGRLLQDFALLFAETSEVIGFSASNGWLEKFMKRHHINFKKLHGKKVTSLKLK